MVNKCIWLTGSRGFIGCYVKKRLVKSGYKVHCISNNVIDDEDLIQIDFSKRNEIRNGLKKTGVPEIAIHMGWGNTDDPHHNNHITLNVDNSIKLIDVEENEILAEEDISDNINACPTGSQAPIVDDDASVDFLD